MATGLKAEGGVSRQKNTVHAARLEIQPGTGLVLADGSAIKLSVKEFGLLCALVSGSGRVMSRAELYETVWGTHLRPGDRTIDVYVRRIRVKLAAAIPSLDFIHTHTGFGYRFDAEDVHS